MPRLHVLKEAADEELVNAVRLAATGRSYLQPELGARLAVDAGDDPDGLSEREVEVLRLIALGHTNTEIAEQLFLSVRTVESHRAHIQQKLRLTKRSELVRYATRPRFDAAPGGQPGLGSARRGRSRQPRARSSRATASSEVAQEALAPTPRLSRTRAAFLRLRRSIGGVRLSIADDGAGFVRRRLQRARARLYAGGSYFAGKLRESQEPALPRANRRKACLIVQLSPGPSAGARGSPMPDAEPMVTRPHSADRGTNQHQRLTS